MLGVVGQQCCVRLHAALESRSAKASSTKNKTFNKSRLVSDHTGVSCFHLVIKLVLEFVLSSRKAILRILCLPFSDLSFSQVVVFVMLVLTLVHKSR